jgi:hypothetical protein
MHTVLKLPDSRGVAHRVNWSWRDAVRARLILFIALIVVAIALQCWSWVLARRSASMFAAVNAAIVSGGGKPIPPPVNIGWPYLPSLVMFLPVVAAGLAIYFQTPRRVSQERRKRGQCGHCGYDLGRTEPGEDGCRVCSECGAAWRDEAKGRP